MITKNELTKRFDCFNKFIDASHNGCTIGGMKHAVIVDKDGRYVCEKCGREVPKDVWASLFKKRIHKPFKKQ